MNGTFPSHSLQLQPCFAVCTMPPAHLTPLLPPRCGCLFIPASASAAGKTYANCFLRTALPPSKRCAKSYDTLRLNVSTPGCQALVSHDDFSVSDTFPEGAATITQLRRWGAVASAVPAQGRMLWCDCVSDCVGVFSLPPPLLAACDSGSRRIAPYPQPF